MQIISFDKIFTYFSNKVWLFSEKSVTIEEREGEQNMVPKDPVMLLSFVNLKLRDFYGSLDALCEDLAIDAQELTDRLAAIDYHYDAERNQFV